MLKNASYLVKNHLCLTRTLIFNTLTIHSKNIIKLYIQRRTRFGYLLRIHNLHFNRMVFSQRNVVKLFVLNILGLIFVGKGVTPRNEFMKYAVELLYSIKIEYKFGYVTVRKETITLKRPENLIFYA